jgi:Tol biopolymer transport system component
MSARAIVCQTWPRPLSAARARLLAPLCLAVAIALCAPATSRADVFGPISLVSEGSVPGASEVQQAEYAHDTAISENGQYIAFDGSFHGVTGVWRAEIRGGRVVGSIEQVAGGGAEYPSISENGQYVSFTTNEGKSLAEITYGLSGESPEHIAGTLEAVNVYVRNMSLGPAQEGAFLVASAQNGSDEQLTYREAETSRGAIAAGRSAISANGNEVAFVTTAVSNLVNPAEVNTPALQVAVRYMESKETRLVSDDRETGGPVSAQAGSELYGAVYADSNTNHAPQFAPAAEYGDGMPPPGASISADGSTVAWMGTSLTEQVPLLAHEAETLGPNYTEPLWRRIALGSETATERVTGGSDPANPACAASGETALPSKPSLTDPCQGPFVVQEAKPIGGIWIGGQQGDPIPRLSADGYTVAFLSRAPLVAAGENFGRGTGPQESDLYIADMHAGLTRDQALTQLTEIAGSGLADEAPIFDFDISPDGSQVAFTTERTQFPLGSPALVSPPAGEAGMNELFDADLADDTLTRVSHGYGNPDEPSEAPHKPVPAGEDPYKGHPGDGAVSPAFSADGSLLAYASTASNLVFGDGNTPPAGPFDGSDAFFVERTVFHSVPAPQAISFAPETATEPLWQLGMTALSRPDGSVLLYVRTPGAGTLRASAQGMIEVAAASHTARHARRGRARRASGRHANQRTTVALRTVASASKVAQSAQGELVMLVLKLAKPYAALDSQGGGLSATISLAFAAPGEPTLHDSIPTSFVRTIKPARRPRNAGAHPTRHKPGRR